MERRSRSQTRGTGGPNPGSNRHASSSRLPESLSFPSRPPEQARTLSPDRRERYRNPGAVREQSSYNNTPHSNSNSYNQYTQGYPGGGYGEVPPPRPNPPATTLSYTNNNNNAPPRPDPPTGYNNSHQNNSTSASHLQQQPNNSPSKNTNISPPESKNSVASNGAQVMQKFLEFSRCLASVKHRTAILAVRSYHY